MEENFIIYEDEGNIKIDVLLEEDNVWLSQSQMSNLFRKSKKTISEHIINILEEKELDENSVIRKFRTTASDGKKYDTNYYSLEMIIAVGMRVRSTKGTAFRIWANQILKEYLVKGYNLNVERFKNNDGGTYFEELLDKIRDIRYLFNIYRL